MQNAGRLPDRPSVWHRPCTSLLDTCSSLSHRFQELPIPDLRTFSGSQPEEPSPEFLDLLYDTMNKQQWFREYRESEGVEELPFVGGFTVSDAAEEVAADIRDLVGIDEARSRANNWEGVPP